MMDKFEQFLLESKFSYLGNYNTVPMKNRDKNFHLMSAMAKPVSKGEFMKNVSLPSDITVEKISEPDIRFFKSTWEGKEVYYFVDEGQEMIFINNNAISF